jgi:hypothetical protein
MTKEQLELEERALALEEKKLAIEAQKLSNEKLRREADEHRMEKQDKAESSKRRGDALRSQRPENLHAAMRRTCNHHMGAKDHQAFVSGRGKTSEPYCVSKVQLPTGDVMIRCSRCRKVWVPLWKLISLLGKTVHFSPRKRAGRLTLSLLRRQRMNTTKPTTLTANFTPWFFLRFVGHAEAPQSITR